MTFTAENIFFMGAVLVFVSIVISKWGYRFGVPTLLQFLFTGMLSLSVILFSGGMDTC